MKMAHKRISVLRWFIPITVTLGFLVLLTHRSSDPLFFSRYSPFYLTILFTMGMWVATSWSVALDADRHHRFTRRIPIVSSMALGIGGLALLDLVFDTNSAYVDFFALAIPLTATSIMWIASATNPANVIHGFALLVASTTIGLTISEGLFRYGLVERWVPTSEEEFSRVIASSWPRHIPIQRDPMTLRIVGLSDSFGEAGGRENYHYLVEDLLQQNGLKVEVVNISKPAYEPRDQLEVLRRFGPRYRPDVVLHGFFVGNDFFIPQGTLLGYRNIPLRSVDGLAANRPRNFLIAQWLSRYAYYKYRGKAQTDGNEAPGTYANDVFLDMQRRRLQVFTSKARVEMRWEQTVEVLDHIRRKSEEIGARYIFVIHPDQSQVEVQLQAELAQTYGLELDEYDFDLPQRFLSNYCISREIECIDLLPIFRARGSEGGLYRVRDTHYNGNGNKLAAKVIASFLRERNIVDARRMSPPPGES